MKGSKIQTDECSDDNFMDRSDIHHATPEKKGGWRNCEHLSFCWMNTVLGNMNVNLREVTRVGNKVHMDRYLMEFH